MNNSYKKSKAFVFAVASTIVLVVTVVGATYAYYTAVAENNTAIQGSAAGAGLTLNVNNISTSANGDLIPLTNNAGSLTTAAKGYGNAGTTFDATKSCIDKNGYSVCQVYEITVQNTSTAAVVLDGGVSKLEGATTPNIACAVMTSSTSVTNNANCVTNNSIANQMTFNAGETKKFYIMVYINNLSTAQDDKGKFTGTVTFISGSGKLEASF